MSETKIFKYNILNETKKIIDKHFLNLKQITQNSDGNNDNVNGMIMEIMFHTSTSTDKNAY